MKDWTRRDLIKALGIAGVSSSFNQFDIIKKNYNPHFSFHGSKPKKQLTAIVCGAGNRGNVYGDYAVKFPAELNIVGVAEPIPVRIDRFSKKHNIDPTNQFVTLEHVFERPKFADIVIITTPDDLHYGPAMKALALGYDLLLEKPIAQSWQECKDILIRQKKYDRIVAVCHVLRYAAYYRKMKEVIDSSVLGDLVSFQHFEPIQYEHMAHSFVRGNWRNEAETNPAILAKSCHDLDILKWWIGKRCLYISSFGSLKLFKESMAPEGSTQRCIDGCKIEKECPYSALRIYYDDRTWLHHFDLPDDETKQGDVIKDYLRNSNYGKCVYRLDNDVVDHQVVSMEFEDKITASFNMEAFTNYHGRRTRVMGTMGHAYGDGTDLNVFDFKQRTLTQWNVYEHLEDNSGHGGGDWGLVSDFLLAVDQHDDTLLTSNLDASMESHLMCFMAEQSRHNKQMIKLEMDH